MNGYLRCTKCEVHDRVRKYVIRCTKKRARRFLIFEALCRIHLVAASVFKPKFLISETHQCLYYPTILSFVITDYCVIAKACWQFKRFYEGERSPILYKVSDLRTAALWRIGIRHSPYVLSRYHRQMSKPSVFTLGKCLEMLGLFKMLCAILFHLYNFKKREKPPWRRAEGCNFTKSNTLSWVF